MIAPKGFSLDNLLEMTGKRGKGIMYMEEYYCGLNGPIVERPGGSLGFKDGTYVLPALPVPDMLTGLVGAIGVMKAIRDRACESGSHHVFAFLMTAAALHLKPGVELFSPKVVEECNQKFK
ncbi:hypothetical protein HG530_015122 [Fusarium avenaceum]|nr:hypothetical protein HG530_015122 [Fusarium avenaceum]KIL93649.1 hypothetical protein FAVG1_02209 [Fusarium avenaceum]